jgi:predicted acyl esterase
MAFEVLTLTWPSFATKATRFSGQAWSKKKMRYREKSEIRDGVRIDWDMPIKMDDGIVLRADIYRPVAEGKYPVIMTYGPYGKWLHFEDRTAINGA